MSNGAPPIQTAPVPPSIAGIPQPVFGSGSATSPATPIDITGSPIIPPPPIGDPEGVPVFPPVPPNTAPVPVPVGPLVGPAIAPAAVPPSIPGVVQPQFVPPGSATVPASLFPDFTTTPPSPPIVFANIFNYGQVAPPNTPGQTPPPIVPSAVATIPQLPWNPSPNPEPPPVNTAVPVVQIVTGLNVGDTLALTTGTWTTTEAPLTYARAWTRNGSPIAGATTPGYTLAAADVGAHIGGTVTAIDSKGNEASANANPVGPILPALPAVTPGQTFNTVLPLVANQNIGTVAATGAPTSFAITSGNGSGYWQINATGQVSATAAAASAIAATYPLGVTATNPGGTSPAVTVNIVVATAPADPQALPVNLVLPVASINDTFAFCNSGQWDSGVDTGIIVSQQWYADGVLIEGAVNGSWYYLGYQGQEAYCAITATNVNGSATVNSNTVAIPGGEPPTLLPSRAAPVRHRTTKAKPKRKR